MKAACDLVKKFHPKKVYANFIIELVNENFIGRKVFDNDEKYLPSYNYKTQPLLFHVKP